MARETGQAEAGDGGLLDRFGVAQLQGLREAAQVRQQRLFDRFAGAGTRFAQQPACAAQFIQRPACAGIGGGHDHQRVLLPGGHLQATLVAGAFDQARVHIQALHGGDHPGTVVDAQVDLCLRACRSSSAMRGGSR